MVETRSFLRHTHAAVSSALCLGAALFAFPRSAEAADIMAWVPHGYLEQQLGRQLEGFFGRASSPGVLSVPVTGRYVRVERLGWSRMHVTVGLRYEEVLVLGPMLMFPAGSTGEVEFDLGVGCQSNRLQFDVSNMAARLESITFPADAIEPVETRVQQGLDSAIGTLTESLIDATAVYGMPQQLKCLSATVGTDEALDLDFDLIPLETP